MPHHREQGSGGSCTSLDLREEPGAPWEATASEGQPLCNAGWEGLWRTATERGCVWHSSCDPLTSGHSGAPCVPRAGHCRAQLVPWNYGGHEVLVHFLLLRPPPTSRSLPRWDTVEETPRTFLAGSRNCRGLCAAPAPKSGPGLSPTHDSGF